METFCFDGLTDTVLGRTALLFFFFVFDCQLSFISFTTPKYKLENAQRKRKKKAKIRWPFWFLLFRKTLWDTQGAK